MAARSRQPRLLITAGPTHEPIDRVRYLANRSSGRMGIAIAMAAAERKWPVTLLLGPVTEAPAITGTHMGLRRFRTTADLQSLLREEWPQHDVLVMAAAVADYRPVHGVIQEAEDGKIRRGRDEITLRLEKTPDLLAEAAAARRPGQLLIGFALEPAARLEASALEKMRRKGIDAIVANPLETMDAETIDGRLYLASGEMLRPAGASLPKDAFAAWMLDAVAELSSPS